MHKDSNDPKAAEARRKWARERMMADPYRRVWSGPNNILEAMRKKFGVAIDTRALAQIREEVLAKKGLTVAEVTARHRETAKKSTTRITTVTAPMAYFSKQLTTIAKKLQKTLPDLTRFVLTNEEGDTTIEYTTLQTSKISGKVKL